MLHPPGARPVGDTSLLRARPIASFVRIVAVDVRRLALALGAAVALLTALTLTLALPLTLTVTIALLAIAVAFLRALSRLRSAARLVHATALLRILTTALTDALLLRISLLAHCGNSSLRS